MCFCRVLLLSYIAKYTSLGWNTVALFNTKVYSNGSTGWFEMGHEFSHCQFTSQAYFFYRQKNIGRNIYFYYSKWKLFFCMCKESLQHKSLYTHSWVCYTPLFLHPFNFPTVLLFKNAADCWTVSLLIDKLSSTASQIQHTVKQNSDTRPKTF